MRQNVWVPVEQVVKDECTHLEDKTSVTDECTHHADKQIAKPRKALVKERTHLVADVVPWKDHHN